MLELAINIVNRFPVEKLYQGPSPVERLKRLEKELQTGNEIYIKRDDLLRPLFGNKIRYIEYIFGHCKANGFDCVLHAGGASSNYMAQLAMAGSALGIPIYILVNGKEPDTYLGNVLIDKYFAKEVRFFSTDAVTNSLEKNKFADELKSRGLNPFTIDYPIGNYLAHLGYMNCFIEIEQQVESGSLPCIDEVFLCSGFQSYIGLETVARMVNSSTKINAFRASIWSKSGLARIFESQQHFLQSKIDEFTDFIGVDVDNKAFHMTDDFVGPGYGKSYPEVYQLIRKLASLEGIFLDPIYTGKAFLGMLSYLNKKEYEGKRVLFIHTGGLINNFIDSNQSTSLLQTL